MSARTRVTEIALALPEAAAEGDQHIGFTVRGRTFAWYQEDHHGDGRVSLVVKAAPGEAAALVAAAPDRLHVPGYLGARGWIGVWLDMDEVDWDEVAELLTESYLLVAPKRLAARVAPRE
jgi:hypothetical protein